MKTTAMLALALVTLPPMVGGPLLAHHGGLVYDIQNPITLKGKVTDFTWTNPHVQIYFDVADEKGNVVNWACEASTPGRLARESGWTKNSLKPGDEITIALRPAKTGAPVGLLVKIVLADGKVLMPVSGGAQ